MLEPDEPVVCMVPPVFDPPLPPPEPALPPGAALSSPPQRTSAMPGSISKAATRIRLIIMQSSKFGS
jgi:hypothetical protein